MHNHGLQSNYDLCYLTDDLVSFIADDKFVVFDTASGATIKVIKKKYPHAIIRRANEIIVYSNISGKAIDIYDSGTYEKVASINGATKDICKLEVDRNGDRAAVIESWDYTRIFDLRKRELVKAVKRKGTYQMFQVVFSDAGKVYVGHFPEIKSKEDYANSYVDEIDAASGEIARSFRVPRMDITGEMYYQDGRLYMVRGNRMLLIYLASGRVEENVKGYKMTSLRADRGLAVSVDKNVLDIYDFGSDALEHHFEYDEEVAHHAFSPSGNKIGVMTATGFHEETIA